MEQKKNELSTKLGSSDTKVIPPELVRSLLEKFIEVYKHSSREGKKQLLQLLIGSISIRQKESRSRTVHEVKLDFDFTEVNLSKTFTLIHLLYRGTDKEVAITRSCQQNTNISSSFFSSIYGTVHRNSDFSLI
ncbi:hypothetical protein HNO89_004430 [Sporosarcina luteola]|nr:hypothetical protein [Sporosarcina luteola]